MRLIALPTMSIGRVEMSRTLPLYGTTRDVSQSAVWTRLGAVAMSLGWGGGLGIRYY